MDPVPIAPVDAGIVLPGGIQRHDPFGQVLAEASANKEEILAVECDTSRIEDVRRNWPFLRDRRIDAYSPILERWLE